MPILETLSNLFTWSPRHQRPPTPDSPVQQSPLSHGISEQLQRSQSFGVDGAADLDLRFSTSGDRSETPGLLPVSAHSPDETRYAERSHPEYRSVRPRPRNRQFIRSRFGMSALTRRQRPLRTDRHSDSYREEQRLFGSNPTVPHDAVQIVPGNTLKNKKNNLQDFAAFKPQNTLSGRAKDSGPVRARGRPPQRAGFQTYSRNNFSRLQNTGYEGIERPSKRQRRDNQMSASSRGMGSDDDDVMVQVASSPDKSSSVQQRTLASPDSSRSNRAKGARQRFGDVGEYRQVEQSVRLDRRGNPREWRRSFSSGNDSDERFTGIAASQRKSADLNTAIGQADAEGGKRDKSPEILKSVEIPVPKGKDGLAESPPLQQQFIAADGTQRSSGMRDSASPDVLQGGKTVKPSVSPVTRSPRKGIGGRLGVLQRSSPSDIRPTNFVSRNSTQKKMFEAASVRIGPAKRLASDGRTIRVVVDTTINALGVNGDDDDRIPLNNIWLATRGDEDCRKVMLQLRSSELRSSDRIDIELSSEKEKDRFCSVLEQKGVKGQDKASKWMDKVFRKGEAEMHRYLGKQKRAESPEVPRSEASRRPKLSASLPTDDGTSYSALSLKSGSTANNPQKDSSVDTYKESSSSLSRRTRSMHHRELNEPIVCDDENDDHAQLTPDITPGKWKKPLVYPRFGRKMAEVDAQDRERLRDGEFLNDNLIGFYIRFLEEHLGRTNKEAAKRVYFFNSYFFATITNTSRGQRGINYEGVQKWTRNVNLFGYDYIVVPINESAHWYVAIICNLPSLLDAGETFKQSKTPEGSASRTGSEVREIPESPGPSQGSRPEKEEVTREPLATMRLSEKDAAATDPKERPAADEWPEHEENPTSSPARLSAADKADDVKKGSQDTSGRGTASQKRKKKKKKPGPPPSKHDARQPIIITFDSLGMSRAPTINALKAYLCEEAKSKRGVEIDRNMVKGMKAPQIPLQSNFSDCGLYLLAYLEKFIQNPDDFATKLLRKEMNAETDWPPLRSGHLRRRLRSFLDELYDEQEQISEEKAGQVTMADRQPVSFLLGSDEPARAETSGSESSEPSAEVPEEDEWQGLDVDEKQTGNASRDRTPQGEPKEENQQGASNTEQAPDPPKQGQEHSGRQAQEVIEVPDSQDPGGTSAPGKDGRQEESKVSKDAPKEVVSVDEETNQDRGRGSVVEVQVSGTPSPGRQDKKRSPRTTRKD